MNYFQAQEYLLSLANIPRNEYMQDQKQCVRYLRRTAFLLHLLGNPEKKIPHYIHVTGTSGKGSVCTFVHSILHVAQKKVGAITSPHPTYLFERWSIGHRSMSKKEFVALVQKIKPILDIYIQNSRYEMVSFPELMTAIGLYYLAQKNVEWAVVEVGCGGRYDATNILPYKDVAVITNIGLDHTDILGDTKEKIAYEKAGIICRGCTVLTTEKGKKTLSVIQKECKKHGTPLIIPKDIPRIIHSDLSGVHFTYIDIKYQLTSIGIHQVHNAVLAIEIAKKVGIPSHTIQKGLYKTFQPLRMEVVSKKPRILLDGAHNRDKMKTTVAAMRHLLLSGVRASRVHLLIGFSHNKDIRGMIRELSTLRPYSIACTRNTINPFRKVADPRKIARSFKKFLPNTVIQTFVDPLAALAWSKKQVQHKGSRDVMLITGSIFLSGEIRKYLTK